MSEGEEECPATEAEAGSRTEVVMGRLEAGMDLLGEEVMDRREEATEGLTEVE
jgi:hypothetical protein